MENSFIDPHYMGIRAGPNAFDLMYLSKSRYRVSNGQFVLLWHNHRLVVPTERTLYREVLST